MRAAQRAPRRAALTAALAEVEAIALLSGDSELAFAAVGLRHDAAADRFEFNAAAAAVVWHLANIQRGQAVALQDVASASALRAGEPTSDDVDLHDYAQEWVARVACAMASVVALIRPGADAITTRSPQVAP